MDFGLSDEQRPLIGTVRRLVDDELRPLKQLVEDSGHLEPTSAEAIHAASPTIGLYAMSVPEELGGRGLSTMDWMLVEEEFRRTTDVLIRHAFGNVYDILLAGSEAQREHRLIPAIRGDRTNSIALAEAEAGSGTAASRTRATPSYDGWSLTGQKRFVSDAHNSDFCVLTAVAHSRAGARAISPFIVDRDMPGVADLRWLWPLQGIGSRAPLPRRPGLSQLRRHLGNSSQCHRAQSPCRRRRLQDPGVNHEDQIR